MKSAIVLVLGIVSAIAAAQSSTTTLSANSAAPLGDLADQLQDMYGYVITYEAPKYVYAGDVEDVTLAVRRDLDKYPPGKAPKVVVPMAHSLTIDAVPAGHVSSAYVAKILQQLVQIEMSGTVGGRYRVEFNENEFHIVPTAIRDVDGNWIEHRSILDTPISIQKKDRSALAMITAICRALEASTRQDVGLMSVPASFLHSVTGAWGADHEPARDVLTRVLRDTGAKLSWRVEYIPSPSTYAMRIAAVQDRADSAGADKDQQNAGAAEHTSDDASAPVVPNR